MCRPLAMSSAAHVLAQVVEAQLLGEAGAADGGPEVAAVEVAPADGAALRFSSMSAVAQPGSARHLSLERDADHPHLARLERLDLHSGACDSGAGHANMCSNRSSMDLDGQRRLLLAACRIKGVKWDLV